MSHLPTPRGRTLAVFLNASSEPTVVLRWNRGAKIALTAVSHLLLERIREQWGKNPELTVCQIRTAAAALVQSLWLRRAAGQELLERTAKKIVYQQQRNVRARTSHTKKTVRKLHRLGI